MLQEFSDLSHRLKKIEDLAVVLQLLPPEQEN
jgi:hypothetical protein